MGQRREHSVRLSVPCGADCGERTVVAYRHGAAPKLPRGWILSGALAYCSEQCERQAREACETEQARLEGIRNSNLKLRVEALNDSGRTAEVLPELERSDTLADYLQEYRRTRLLAIRDTAEKKLNALNRQPTAWRVLRVTPTDPAYWRQYGIDDPESGLSPSIGYLLNEAEAHLGPRPARGDRDSAWEAAEVAAVADRAMRATRLDIMRGLDKWAEIYAAALAGDPEAQAKVEKHREECRRGAEKANKRKRMNYAARDDGLRRQFERLRVEGLAKGWSEKKAAAEARRTLAGKENLTIKRVREIV